MLCKTFEISHPYLAERIISAFKTEFPEGHISIFSFFLEEQRSFGFEITIDGNQPVMIIISIFNCFLVRDLAPGSNRHYIDQGEEEFIDSIYERIIRPHAGNIPWITRKQLTTEIPKFNLGYGQDGFDKESNQPRYVAELLTAFY